MQSNFALRFLVGDLNCDMIATRYDNDTCKLMSITDVLIWTSTTYNRTNKSNSDVFNFN